MSRCAVDCAAIFAFSCFRAFEIFFSFEAFLLQIFRGNLLSDCRIPLCDNRKVQRTAPYSLSRRNCKMSFPNRRRGHASDDDDDGKLVFSLDCSGFLYGINISKLSSLSITDPETVLVLHTDLYLAILSDQRQEPKRYRRELETEDRLEELLLQLGEKSDKVRMLPYFLRNDFTFCSFQTTPAIATELEEALGTLESELNEHKAVIKEMLLEW